MKARQREWWLGGTGLGLSVLLFTLWPTLDLQISLAFFDLGLYAPTKEALQAMQSRLMKGSILVFDELNYEFAPGETQAVIESLDLKQYTVQRFEHCSRVSFIQL
jgi:hypothetical protein